MSHWPQPAPMPIHQVTISQWSSGSIMATLGPITAPFGGAAGNVNRLFAYPFRIQRAMVVRRAWWFNGATPAGNIITGVYGTSPSKPSDGQEVKLAETASTAAGAANTIVAASIGPINLPPGLYWAALITSTTTEMFRVSSGLNIDEARHIGAYRLSAEGSFALPTSLTTPNSTINTIPVFGLATQTVI